MDGKIETEEMKEVQIEDPDTRVIEDVVDVDAVGVLCVALLRRGGIRSALDTSASVRKLYHG